MAISGRFQIGEWSIDPALDEISRGEDAVKLEPRMMRLLCRLAESRGQVVGYQELLENVWAGVVVGPASVYQAVSALRKILGDTGRTPTYIATVARKGYRLVAEVESAATASPGESAKPPVAPGARRPARRTVIVTALAALGLALAAAVAMFLSPSRETSVRASPADTSSAWPPPGLPSIHILPFQASAPGEANELFAATFTNLLHNRLMTQQGLLALSPYLPGTMVEPAGDAHVAGSRLGANYVLRGEASRTTGQLQLHVVLIDSASGKELWSQHFARSLQDITALREEIVSQVGTRMNVRIGTVGDEPINLEAHELYVRGMQEYLKISKEGFVAARDIFQRATTLYPEYARGYFGLALTLRQLFHLAEISDPPAAKRLESLTVNALDRALELDPDFGEAMLDRAELIDDPVQAEAMFRRGMDLAPSNEWGPIKYGFFLSRQGRTGEGQAALDRALRIDPRSFAALEGKANILLRIHGDIPGHEALLREMIAAHPDNLQIADTLAWSRLAWSGGPAEAITMFERHLAQDPDSIYAKYGAALAYLEVDDLQAAVSAAGKGSPAQLEIDMYQRKPRPIAPLPENFRTWLWTGWSSGSTSPICESLRDEAMRTGAYSAALTEFDKIRPGSEDPSAATAPMDLVHAHVLLLSGDAERGRALVNSVLRALDAEQAGRPAHWFARLRATAYALLGNDERSLAELTVSVQHKDLNHWWYTADHDPVFTNLRKDPQFQALVAEVKEHRVQQRALLDEMRRKGEVPNRP